MSGHGTAEPESGPLPQPSGEAPRRRRFVDTPPGSVGKQAARVTARLAAGGMATWGKLGAGLYGDVPWRDVGSSMLPAVVLSAGAGEGDGDDAKTPAVEEVAAANDFVAEAGPTRADERRERDEVGFAAATLPLPPAYRFPVCRFHRLLPRQCFFSKGVSRSRFLSRTINAPSGFI